MAYDVVVYGVGGRLESLARMLEDPGIRIVAYGDGDPAKRGRPYRGLPIAGPDDVAGMDFDYVLVFSVHYSEIRKALLGLGVPRHKVLLVNAVPDDVYAGQRPRQDHDATCSAYIRDVEALANRTPSIVSDDCWGGLVSQMYNIPFGSPFVGAYILPEDYLTLLERFDDLPGAPLEFVGECNGRPVGRVAGAEIEFRHYRDEDHARRKWEERVRRLDPDNLFVKMVATDPGHTERIDRFNALPFANKVCFTTFDHGGREGCVRLSALDQGDIWGTKVNLVTAARLEFDLVRWLNGGRRWD